MTRIIFLLVLFAALISCNKNEAPTCQIINPVNDAVFLSDESVVINLEATDPDGVINEIRLFIDDIGITSLSSSPSCINKFLNVKSIS